MIVVHTKNKLTTIISENNNLGCIQINTGTSPGICALVIVNTSLHVFQWQPFTLK